MLEKRVSQAVIHVLLPISVLDELAWQHSTQNYCRCRCSDRKGTDLFLEYIAAVLVSAMTCHGVLLLLLFF